MKSFVSLLILSAFVAGAAAQSKSIGNFSDHLAGKAATGQAEAPQRRVTDQVMQGGDTPPPPIVPEPATMAVLGVGAAAMAWRRRRSAR